MFTFSNINESVKETLSTNHLLGFVPSNNIIQFAKFESCYKAMLFLDSAGNFVPAVSFRSPYVGKRLIHTVTDYRGSFAKSGVLVSCVKQEEKWTPTNGVSILWVLPDGTLQYTCTSLTEWERAHKFSFLSSFGWLKGENAYETIGKLGSFAQLHTTISLAEISRDDAIRGITRQEWFLNAYHGSERKL